MQSDQADQPTSIEDAAAVPEVDELADDTYQRVIAAIDVGTNSVHMVLARIADRTRVEVLTREKDSVRLGSGLDGQGVLSEAAMQRGIDALGRCARLASERDAQVVAVGTSALRDATNADEFIRRAAEIAGVDLTVIPGREEARLIYLGILQSLPVYDRTVALIDIGGGSTEVLIGTEEKVRAARSFKLGAIRTTREFFDGDVVDERAVARCRGHIRSTIAPFVRKAHRHGFDIAVGSSGTIETIAAMALAASGDVPNNLNAQEISRRSVMRVVEQLIAAPSAEERAKLPGIDPGRADILLAGALILDEIMESFGMSRFTVSEAALREGLLLDSWRRITGRDLTGLRDLRSNSIDHLMESCDDDPAHARHVAKLAVKLFDELAPLHGLNGDQRELLYGGAMLCNVGQVVSHARHHVHAYYVIRETDRLNGFTEREIEMMALIARFHRRSMPAEDRHEEFAAMTKVDRAVLESLVALVRLAIALDRSHAGLVDDVEATITRDKVILHLVPVEGVDPALERYAAAGRLAELSEAMGRPIEFAS